MPQTLRSPPKIQDTALRLPGSQPDHEHAIWQLCVQGPCLRRKSPPKIQHAALMLPGSQPSHEHAIWQL
eukprot:648088-Pelagomonas_calceolata.AAC.1